MPPQPRAIITNPFLLFSLTLQESTRPARCETVLILLGCYDVKSFVVVDICEGTLITLFASEESVKNSSPRHNAPTVEHYEQK